MYDWANSAFSTTVATTFLGPYLASLIRANQGAVNVLGLQIDAAAFFPFCVSVGALVDYSSLKKPMMMGFAYQKPALIEKPPVHTTGGFLYGHDHLSTALLKATLADLPLLGLTIGGDELRSRSIWTSHRNQAVDQTRPDLTHCGADI